MNERSIFMEALDQDTPAKRSAYLEGACGGDAALRQRVDALAQGRVASAGLVQVGRALGRVFFFQRGFKDRPLIHGRASLRNHRGKLLPPTMRIPGRNLATDSRKS